MARPLRATALQLKTAQRLVRRRAPIRERLAPLGERLVFVVGSPRSGTTFLGRSLGSLPGFVDLGEVAPLKAAIPELAALPSDQAARRLRAILDLTRRLGLVGAARAVEQTPETAFLIEAALAAYPEARVVHMLRDGRDVVCSLLDRGWLSPGREGTDDAWRPYGAGARFWVEPERGEEFAKAGEARRAAWAWRRYVEAARRAPERTLELRYERVGVDSEGVAEELARFLGAPAPELAAALGQAHESSVGRYRRELTPEQLEDVLAESGALLRGLGYLA